MVAPKIQILNFEKELTQETQVSFLALMKSSKGKGPAGGAPKTPKKPQLTASGKFAKEKAKDPVEVSWLPCFGQFAS